MADRSELEAERDSLRALVVRYWCGDGPVGAGATSDICVHIMRLPVDEREVLLAAVDDSELDAALSPEGSNQ